MTQHRALAAPLLVFALVAFSACGKSNEERASTGASSNAELAVKTADRIWYESCQVCHGAEGKGDGEGARNLSPKPRAMDDPQWQAKITDPQIRRVIIKGGAAVGLSKSMPPTPSLASDKAALDALVAKIRGLSRAKKGSK